MLHYSLGYFLGVLQLCVYRLCLRRLTSMSNGNVLGIYRAWLNVAYKLARHCTCHIQLARFAWVAVGNSSSIRVLTVAIRLVCVVVSDIGKYIHGADCSLQMYRSLQLSQHGTRLSHHTASVGLEPVRIIHTEYHQISASSNDRVVK